MSPLGYEAVLLFFVLSGFVLSLPAVEGRPQSYLTFVTRRVFRLYVPYLAALAFSVAGAFWLHGPLINSHFVDRCWLEPVSWRLVGQHVLLIGVFDVSVFDPPIWSLVHEMRISLFFPFLCAIVLRLKNGRAFVLALFLTAASFGIDKLPGVESKVPIGSETAMSVADTVFYAALFILGIYLARERESIGGWFRRLSRSARVSFGIGCVLLYGFAGPQLMSLAPRFTHWHLTPVVRWLTALGAGGLIVICINSQTCKRVLYWPPIHRLGQMSYSLYLMHLVVILVCLHLLRGKIPMAAILLLVLVLAMVVSWFSYRWIELPSMNQGRKLSNAFQRLSAAGDSRHKSKLTIPE
jgi:peptidoglycan/LPS O-acetylase OafA/YrhL